MSYISLVLSVNVLYLVNTIGKCVIYISLVQKNKIRPKKFSVGPTTFASTKGPVCDAEQFRLVSSQEYVNIFLRAPHTPCQGF